MLYKISIAFFILLGNSLYAQKVYTLGQAVATARTNNPDLITEKYSINIASSNITSARLRPNPVFNNQTIQLFSSQYFPSPDKPYTSPYNQQIWYQLTKPMLLGNMRSKRIDFAKQSVVSATTGYSELNRTICYETAIKWLDSWQLKTNLIVYIDAKKNIDSLVSINQRSSKDKDGSSIESIRSQLLSDQYKLKLKSLNNEYIDKLRILKYTMGVNDSINISEVNVFISSDFFDNKDTLFKIAFERRGDLAHVKSNIELSRKNIAVQKAAALPYFEGGFIFNPQNTIMYAGTFATFSIPVFARNQGEREKAEFIYKQSENYKETKERQIRQEIENAHFSFVTHKDILKEFDMVLKDSYLLLNSVKLAYAQGSMTIVDYLEAQKTYLEMRYLYTEADYNFKKSCIDVLYSTGLILDLN